MGLDKKEEEGREGQDRKDTRELEKDKETQNTVLKNVMGAEVTWTAVAAIGGSIVVIWNIVKYFFTFCSSLFLLHNTHVPLYLLMKRQNLPFTDMFLVVVTMAIMGTIISFTRYNPLLYMGGKTKLLLCRILMLVFIIIFVITIFRLNNEKNQSGVIYITMLLNYFFPLFLMVEAFIIGKTVHEHKRMRKLFPYYKQRKLIKFTAFQFLLLILFSILLSVFNVLSEQDFYLDQNNKYLVADLGEQYIVQQAFIDDENKEIVIDNSCYYVIEKTNEIMRVANGRQGYFSEYKVLFSYMPVYYNKDKNENSESIRPTS